MDLPEIDLPEIDKEFLAKPKLAFTPSFPEPKNIVPQSIEKPTELSSRQKQTVNVISYALHLQGITITPEEIATAWPVGSTEQTLRAGKKPQDIDIASYLDTEEYRVDAEKRGVAHTKTNGLTDRQAALIDIISDTTLRMGLESRLQRAGVKRAEFRAWKRQAAFNAAFKRAVGEELKDAAETLDVQLLSQAANGNLKAIQYANELMGRGPNNKQNVDAQKFVQLVLESIMRHCSTEQIQAIHADLELASKMAIEK